MKTRSQTGYSILEVLVVVGIIIAGLATYPFLSSFMTTFQLTAAGQNIASELQTARYLAIARNDQTSIHYIDGTGNDVTNSPSLDSSSSGFIAYVRSNVRGIRVVNPAGNALRPDIYLPSTVQFTWVPDTPLGFNSRGTPNNVDPADKIFTINNSTGNIDIIASLNGGRIKIVDRRSGN